MLYQTAMRKPTLLLEAEAVCIVWSTAPVAIYSFCCANMYDHARVAAAFCKHYCNMKSSHYHNPAQASVNVACSPSDTDNSPRWPLSFHCYNPPVLIVPVCSRYIPKFPADLNRYQTAGNIRLHCWIAAKTRERP